MQVKKLFPIVIYAISFLHGPVVFAQVSPASFGRASFSDISDRLFWAGFRYGGAIVLGSLLVYALFRILRRNQDFSRELLRQLLKRINKKTNYVVFKEQGKHIRIATNDICFIKASGNYIEIQTDTKKYLTRYKIGNFLQLVPDPLEYLRISRSSIIRLDKVQEKSKKEVTVRGEKISIGETYLAQLQKIKF